LQIYTNDHGYTPFVVITNRFFPHSWHITGCVAREAHVEQKLLTLPEHLSSLPV